MTLIGGMELFGALRGAIRAGAIRCGADLTGISLTGEDTTTTIMVGIPAGEEARVADLQGL